ncbi:sensor histidine kinase [Acetobacterium bakii]|uniref:Sensor histidine kinase NatK-like C-terminal domain-containing protein n=1 Tax=Acetobacterium bakii TaxID=52689 RepID=A0A0L6TY98_9FIRM|nr:ATP-binding protein [Acetobacterium bakii]KNZ41249.1 hypothetical protein AKG39_13100 [Acetobacterium bakii]
MIYHYLGALLTLPLLFAILSTIIEFRFPRKKCILLMTATIAFLYSPTAVLILMGFNLMELYSYVSLSTGVPCLLCFLYLARYRDGSFLFAFLSVYVLAAFGTIFSFIAAIYLPFQNEIEIIFLHFSFLLILYLIFRYLFRAKYFPAARARGNLWSLYCLLPLLSLVLIKMYANSPGQNWDIGNKVTLPYLGFIYPYAIPALVVLLVLFCCMLILIMLMITSNHRIAMEREEKMHLDFYAETLNQRLADTEEKNDNLRILRHDIHFHINAVSSMLQQHKMDDAATYLHDLGGVFNQTKIEKYSVNPSLNAILDFYAQKTAELSIGFIHAIKVPREMPLADIDLGVIISNALENAINACNKMSDQSKPYVDIKFIRHRQQYILDICNPYEGLIAFDDNRLPITERTGHGYGTKSIIAICKKYNATVDYLAESGIFTLRIMFTE